MIYKVDMYSQYYHTTCCKRYGIPECTRNEIVLGRFIRGPDDDSKVVVETCSPEVVEYNKSVLRGLEL